MEHKDPLLRSQEPASGLHHAEGECPGLVNTEKCQIYLYNIFILINCRVREFVALFQQFNSVNKITETDLRFSRRRA